MSATVGWRVTAPAPGWKRYTCRCGYATDYVEEFGDHRMEMLDNEAHYNMAMCAKERGEPCPLPLCRLGANS